MIILPPENLGTFFEEARRSGVFELYYIDLATGLRRGELLGLKWSDIDLVKGQALVSISGFLLPAFNIARTTKASRNRFRGSGETVYKFLGKLSWPGQEIRPSLVIPSPDHPL